MALPINNPDINVTTAKKARKILVFTDDPQFSGSA
jgi:hypothetical protein